MSDLQLDRAGRRRSPATMPGFLAGRSPRNKGVRYPADPPKVEEIIAVMRAAGDSAHGQPAVERSLAMGSAKRLVCLAVGLPVGHAISSAQAKLE